MGKCEYVFAQDCSKNKLFTVYTKNQRCGWGGASCAASVTVVLAGYKIQFSRAKRTAIINGVKHTIFPFVRPGELYDKTVFILPDRMQIRSYEVKLVISLIVTLITLFKKSK